MRGALQSNELEFDSPHPDPLPQGERIVMVESMVSGIFP
jgi:hypothetical protein